ncbi:MAG: radical SAM protein [Candidatus Diapherotrites archaeon]|uniref:Radical SAM protein n=1 Tax=Candidatus Iainarchaeum sp. TaxID=3101447 RepID=A0A7J4JYW1_9ARCH|nr:MAG: magnesium-protoporphyrin IX monomethyl ester (oxidative) cyclase [archaeon GW2011_AR21]MBS3057909.1 radical SAM protein [Candidatus Diapherotrites archaeon]HIH21455.1 radical SAM protein [Candidatus Diapherotrites archaeon]
MQKKRLKILMLNPPFLPKFSRSSRSPAVTKGGTIYYPLWLAYTTGVLEKAGFETMLLDAPAESLSLQETAKKAAEFKPGMVVLDTSTASIYNDVKVAEELKKKLPKAFTVLVGPHVSALPKESLSLSKKISAVAKHEYDYILRDLALELEKKKPRLKKVKGLVFRSGKKISENPDMPFIENLDYLPFVSKVYKKHLNYKNYFYSANLWPEITILTGRGCPHRCTFCVWPQTMSGRAYRHRSVENVVEEFKYIKENFPDVKEIFIEDDTLTANRERVRQLCKSLVEQKVKIAWSCNARADVDLETLQWMKKAGCRLLCVGFESGVQEILNNIKKGTRIETIRQFMKDAKRAGILVHGCFMLGNQGETKETIKKTIEFAKELDPDTAQFFPIMVYPGTESFDFFKQNQCLTTLDFKEWVDSEGMHNTIVSRPGLSAKELVQLCDLGRREFYLRPGYVAKKAVQSITRPGERKRIFKSAKTFAKYLLKK